MKKYPEYKTLNLAGINKEVLEYWKEKNVFQESINQRDGAQFFSFYEGPPSANGMPGIHHVISRTIKDVFCRYKTLKGFKVNRKAGWDTHGLPVELSVEKELGITKEDIGKKISIEEYNKQCRINVMKYKGSWESLTEQMGYWVDMEDPYLTYTNKYIESVWWLLGELHKKDLLYKGYTVQPYSPKAGTGLSTHELNQPGCYRKVKDNSVTAQFKLCKDKKLESLFKNINSEIYLLAWTTTPWTLPSNCALAVGKKITYQLVKTFNKYTFKPIVIILAKDLLYSFFDKEKANIKISDYKEGDKNIPFEVLQEIKGEYLCGIKYEQLLPYVQPDSTAGEAFKVIPGDFVSTEEGTGVVHTASVFGADDYRVCQQNNIPSILVKNKAEEMVPVVDKQGRFVEEITDFSGEYVRAEYEDEEKVKEDNYLPVDVKIIIKLKKENKAFHAEKYEHSYPHCWRTDKPILYYPLESWFVKTTKFKTKMLELNKQINWKPTSTGEGRFGNWLENLVDWNLSRSRFWGIPLPIWRTDDGKEEICIHSMEQLKEEINKSIQNGFMEKNPLESFVATDFSKKNYNSFDVHKPYIDKVVLTSAKGQRMQREKDLIDVWFDSGAMPYAQLHYPFENKDSFKKNYPADFIAEGVDQTRGWFFTLHAIGTMLFDSVAYKNVVSNGLVLDKEGNKMSKRLGNAIDPFQVLNKYGADATRWYMISNAQPWDNLRFNKEGLQEVQRKFFGTLYNTYSFFSLYANIDEFDFSEKEIPVKDRPEIDRWVLTELYDLIEKTESFYENYEPTKASREIQDFVINDLSNWYVRLTRRRFWKGEYGPDKIAAYQTLYTCLVNIAKIASPIAPFFMDKLYADLNNTTGCENKKSIHLSSFPQQKKENIDADLQQKIRTARDITSLGLSLRKKEQIKVRQPLQKLIIPILNQKQKEHLLAVKDLILSELNIKELELIEESSKLLVKKAKPNFKTLGPKYGKLIKDVVLEINKFTNAEILKLEKGEEIPLVVNGKEILITQIDVEITTEDIPGWKVVQDNDIAIAVDMEISDSLKQEGLARELVNRIQNIRKEKAFEVTDHINIEIKNQEKINDAINNNLSYICEETLAKELQIVDVIPKQSESFVMDGVSVELAINKV